MSYTEVHCGTLTEVEVKHTDPEDIEELQKELLLRENIDIPEEYSIEDVFIDELGKTYFIAEDKEGNSRVFKISDHQETDTPDYFENIKKQADGSYHFSCSFYNGGTCLSEMLEDMLSDSLQEEEGDFLFLRGDDWEILFVDGENVASGHEIDAWEMLHLSGKYGFTHETLRVREMTQEDQEATHYDICGSSAPLSDYTGDYS